MRYHLIDNVRGINLISMMAYHLVWDLVYLFGQDWAWYRLDLAYVWQQAICWTFILLSGFCWSMGHHRLRRGLIVFVAGALVTAVTVLFMPQDVVIFGVLTLLGSCMLLMIPLEYVCRRVPPIVGLAVSVLLFAVTRNISRGELGFEGMHLLSLPETWYHHGYLMTYLGLKDATFFSTDYFAMIPWLFLFVAGYFLYRWIGIPKWFTGHRIPMLSWIGQHSLILYMVHQPVIYAILLIVLT